MERRRAAEREAELKERIAILRQALRETLEVFNTYNEHQGRRTKMPQLDQRQLVAMIHQAQRIGYAALGSHTSPDLEAREEISANSPLASLLLEVRLQNALEAHGFHTIRDVVDAPEIWISQIPNVSTHSIAALRRRLLEHGFVWHEQGAAALTVPSG